jgi:hypothetical protein
MQCNAIQPRKMIVLELFIFYIALIIMYHVMRTNT